MIHTFLLSCALAAAVLRLSTRIRLRLFLPWGDLSTLAGLALYLALPLSSGPEDKEAMPLSADSLYLGAFALNAITTAIRLFALLIVHFYVGDDRQRWRLHSNQRDGSKDTDRPAAAAGLAVQTFVAVAWLLAVLATFASACGSPVSGVLDGYRSLGGGERGMCQTLGNVSLALEATKCVLEDLMILLPVNWARKTRTL